MERPPERVKLAGISVAVFIDSLNSRSKTVLETTVNFTMVGAIISGELLKTEFCEPGVPPTAELLAVQLALS